MTAVTDKMGMGSMRAGLVIGMAVLCLGQTGEAIAQDQAMPPAVAPAPDAPGCELHVFPTENYIGFNSGLLSGFGPVGAVVDQETHKNKVATITDLMRDYLGPDIQLGELEKINYLTRLGVQDYKVIIEPPTPSNEAVKADPAIKAKVKALNADLKAGKRITSSTNPCYAEFILVSVFYFKAMMYGSNLLVGTQFRDFSKGGAPVVSIGAVKNPLEVFPPKSADMVEPAKAELREAFAKDFIEWTEKKLKDGKVTAR